MQRESVAVGETETVKRESGVNSSAGRHLSWALWLLVAGAVMMTVLLALTPAAGHDQLWFLLMAKRWLGGAQLYGPEVFDSNPPMIVWVSALPVWVAAHIGVAASLVGKLLVVVLDAAVAWLALNALELSTGKTSRNGRLWLAFGFVVIFGAVEARDFGQRDALTALLLLPYVLVAAAWSVEGSGSETKRGLRIAAVLLAALGVCLKVQLALVPGVIEAVLLVRALLSSGTPGSRSAWLRRLEPWILVVVGAVYLLAIRGLTPLYFASAVRLNLMTYWAIGHLTLVELFVQAIGLHALLAMALASMTRERKEGSRFAAAITMLCVAGLAATVAYYVQGTGWYYQQLPAISFFGCAVVLQLLSLAERKSARRAARLAAKGVVVENEDVAVVLPIAIAALVVLAGVLTIHFAGFGFTPRGFDADHTFQITRPDPGFFTALAPGTPVAILTTSVDDAMMPIERYHLQWAQSMNNLWLLPAWLRTARPQTGDWPVPARHRLSAAQQGELLQTITSREAGDLARWKPVAVLVARCQDAAVHCQELEDRHDDLLGTLLLSSEFAEQWREYRLARSSGMYDEYVRGW